jgi:acyl dehydratase
MPIDLDRVVGATLPSSTFMWTDDDVILYHLGIGAGFDPVDELELRYVYEADLVVIPTFANIPPFSMTMGIVATEGLEVDLAQILHGEQETILHDAIPTRGTVRNEGSIVGVYDKGKGALAVVEIVSILEATGEPIFTNRSSIYIRGEGGFGGDPGPPTTSFTPDREPDHVVTSITLPQQALLYRMVSGDRNPLHVDPGFAAFAGYDRPILHGLCTYGIVAKAVTDTAVGGRPAEIASYRGRFAGVVYPGESIITSIWDEGDQIRVEAISAERGVPVVSTGLVTRR